MYQDVLDCLRESLAAGGSVWVAGNGGSYSDAHHLMGELRKGFRLKRPVSDATRQKLLALDEADGALLADKLQRGLAVFALENGVLGSAICNDLGGDYLYAQQLMGVVKPGDVFIAISTSGNSRSLCLAAITAKALGAKVVGFTGKTGGRLRTLADKLLQTETDETYQVQEKHLQLYHQLCMDLEQHFFGANE